MLEGGKQVWAREGQPAFSPFSCYLRFFFSFLFLSYFFVTYPPFFFLFFGHIGYIYYYHYYHPRSPKAIST